MSVILWTDIRLQVSPVQEGWKIWLNVPADGGSKVNLGELQVKRGTVADVLQHQALDLGVRPGNNRGPYLRFELAVSSSKLVLGRLPQPLSCLQVPPDKISGDH